MSVAVVYTRARAGIDAPAVTVEIHISGGLPGFSIVGLPETAVREARDRVRGALLASRFEFPQRRIIANLAPADLPKEGGRFDLPVAVGILIASGQLQTQHTNRVELIGELGLDGSLRGVPGALPASLAAGAVDRGLIAAADNDTELGFAQQVPCWTYSHLLQVCEFLARKDLPPPAPRPLAQEPRADGDSLDDVRGQNGAKRALEIAAAGGHNVLMSGPPGTGKSMLARRLISLLPPLTDQAVVEVASVHSVAGLQRENWRAPPFRDPHHSASAAAVVGGGSHPRPGEVTLAHHGVLFLDEMPEFSRAVLETLREPLETGEILIARARHRARYPARFQLVGAMNPCPAGRICSTDSCVCSRDARQRYQARISSPLMDRIDLHVGVDALEPADLRQSAPPSVQAQALRRAVEDARARQTERGQMNRDIQPRGLEQAVNAEPAALRLLDDACRRLHLSMRGYHRSLRVARSIADLANSAVVNADHVAEALSYRSESAPP